MENFIEDLATYLHNQTIGVLATDLFIGTMTGTPDNQIMVAKTGGLVPDMDVPIAQPTAQITVRNTDFNAGEAKIHAIYDLLHGRLDTFQLVAGGADVMKSEALQEPTHMGQDSEFRHLFTCNFVFMVRT